MKKLSKMTKRILTLVIAIAFVAGSIVSVKAASETIQLGDAPYVNERYIAGVGFYHKQTTDGQELYCLNIHKSTARNTQATLVKNSKYIDGGIVYILKNGYPNKSITGNSDKDYYITQTAVWWYLDEVHKTSNLGEQFKSTGSETANGKGMRAIIKNLVSEAKQHTNDSINITDSALSLSSSSNSMSLSNGYYVSGDIKASTATNVSSYIVSISNAPSGTKIVKSDGTETDAKNEVTINANESFKVKVPVKSVANTAEDITVNAKATGNTSYTAYEYQPTNSKMQNVALLEKVTKNVNTTIKLTINSSKVTVIKTDSVTGKPLAGAKLVLKDSNGNIKASWTSTVNAHIIRNLANGTYTLEETEAPSGYLLNKNKTTFTISDNDNNIKITYENAPKKVVVQITKIDQETNKPLAGAVLVLKDSNGKIIKRFTTTTDTTVFTDLENGTYTVEEESAPTGYMKSDEKITFTIDDEHLSHQINFINVKETIVPNTASSASIILTILGIVITGTGITYIYKNRKNA